MKSEKLYTLKEARDILFFDKVLVTGDHRNILVERINENTDQAVADALQIFLNGLDIALGENL
tara:strand:- start:241 stop:429 length:189 start_codon:yes stop_codon:yes gene_type:complete